MSGHFPFLAGLSICCRILAEGAGVWGHFLVLSRMFVVRFRVTGIGSKLEGRVIWEAGVTSHKICPSSLGSGLSCHHGLKTQTNFRRHGGID